MKTVRATITRKRVVYEQANVCINVPDSTTSEEAQQYIMELAQMNERQLGNPIYGPPDEDGSGPFDDEGLIYVSVGVSLY